MTDECRREFEEDISSVHCPFCGDAGEHYASVCEHNPLLWRVRCAYCGSSTGWRTSVSEAIAAWNLRADKGVVADEKTVERVARAIFYTENAYQNANYDEISETAKRGAIIIAKAAIAAMGGRAEQWRPIEELESNGEKVLGYWSFAYPIDVPAEGMEIISRDENGFYCAGGFYPDHGNYTHFMKLPKPPAKG